MWGIYRLGQVAFTPLVGAIAALLLLTRFDFAFLAARGYVDVPYMALVVWAAVMEAVRPRRGWPVFALLALAGLLRPEAWILSGLYFLWMSRGATWGERARYAALTAIAPLAWAAVDFAVTGDPLFSLHYTSSSAEDLGRQRTLGEIPSALPSFFASIVKLPVLLGALAGLGFALLAAPRRAVMPLVLLLSGIGTFVLIGIAGLSVIERYLIVAALALLVFAAVALGGFTMLRPGRRADRRGRSSSAAAGAGRRRLHRHARRPHAAHQRAAVPRRRPHLAGARAQRPGGEGGAALRPADGAEPQARPRRALDPRPAARQGARPRRPRRARSARSRAASRST